MNAMTPEHPVVVVQVVEADKPRNSARTLYQYTDEHGDVWSPLFDAYRQCDKLRYTVLHIDSK